MSQTKVAITIEEGLLARIDALVRRKIFSNRSRAIQEAVQEKLERLERSRLAEECAKLDPEFERAMADEGLSEGEFFACRWREATVSVSHDTIEFAVAQSHPSGRALGHGRDPGSLQRGGRLGGAGNFAVTRWKCTATTGS